MASTHLSLEFLEHRIRATVASVTKSASKITDCFEVEIPAREDGGEVSATIIGTALGHELRAHRVKPQRTVVILPKSQVTTRRVTLPSADLEEIGRMAQFEAERHIPFHPERHIVSHHLISADSIEGALVFLAAVDSPVVTRVLESLRVASIAVDAITVSSAVSCNALLACEGEELAEKQIALVDIGVETTDISVIGKGELLFTRSINVGARALLAASGEGGEVLDLDSLRPMRVGADEPDAGRAEIIDQFVARMAGELRRTHEFARREYHCPALEEIVVTGMGSIVRDLPEQIGRRVGLPGRGVDSSRIADRCAPEFIESQGIASNFTGVGALLLPPVEGAISINLTPEEYRAKRRAERTRQLLVVTGVLALFTVILTMGYLRMSLQHLRESAERYRARVDQLEPLVEEMEDRRTQIRIIRSFVDERNSALAILDYLCGLDYMPPLGHSERGEDVPDVLCSLHHFEYDRIRGTLELSGDIRDIPDLTAMRQNLRDTGFFSDVPVPTSRWRPQAHRRNQVLDFTFECDLLIEEVPTGNTDNDTSTQRRRTGASPREVFLEDRR